VWLRSVIFQVHLWTGLILGLYVVVMSATGAAIVFRGELGHALTPLKTVVPAGPRKTVEELTVIAQELYPRLTVTDVRVSSDVTAAVEVVLTRSGRRRDRIFDPYTGKDLGDRVPREPRSIEWLVDLHDNLLGGAVGRTINGIGAVFFTMLCLTGAVIWWPGNERWRLSTTVRWNVSWRRFVWDVHSAMGFWLFSVLLMWAVSGVYLAFPEPFNFLVEALQTKFGAGGAAFGSAVLADLADLHFGRFAGTGMKVAWVIFGLVPAALFATGLLMWWTRVVRSRAPGPPPTTKWPAHQCDEDPLAS
jgi:uncharacterized iron-regulated membrane protein